MERMEAEKQVRAEVASSKWTGRKAANKTDVAFEQDYEGRGIRTGVKTGGWRRRIPFLDQLLIKSDIATQDIKYINFEHFEYLA